MITKKQSKEAQRRQGGLRGWVTPIIIILALFLASCGGAAPAAPAAPAATEEPAPAAAEATEPAEEIVEATEAPAAAPAEKTKIAYWYDPSFSAEGSACFVAQVVDTFNAQSKLAEVEATAQPNNWDATRTALAGGSGPDVVTTPGPSFAFELAKAGQLAPLDDFAQEFGWADIFVPWALDLGKVDGVLYSIPAEQESLVLYYNKTLFDEKGWQPPKTIDELMALSEKIAAEDIIPFAHANAEWRAANEWFVGEMLNHGADQKVYEALTGKRTWDDPEFVAALEILNTMQKNGWFMGGLDRYYTTTGDERDVAFGDGKAAMKIEGTWFLGEIDNFFGEAAGNQNEWDWVPVPSTGGEAIFDLGIGSTYSISKNTQSPQAVAEFITYLFSPETQARLVVECNYGAAPVKLEAGALEGIDARRARVYEAMAEASVANNYGYTTWTFWPPKSDVYIYEEVEKVWAGDITSEQYLAGLQKLFAEELEAGDIPPIPTRE